MEEEAHEESDEFLVQIQDLYLEVGIVEYTWRGIKISTDKNLVYLQL